LAITKERDFTYPQSQGSNLYRRSLYTFWRRTVAPANMFDASNRQTCRVRSAATSTPLHALTTLNDPTWVEAARGLAAQAWLAEPRDERRRLEWAWMRVTCRPLPDAERLILENALAKQRRHYATEPAAAPELLKVGSSAAMPTADPIEAAAWTNVCLAILNLDESLTRE
jgi:hypothetical protein